jgi:hypothetical protein
MRCVPQGVHDPDADYLHQHEAKPMIDTILIVIVLTTVSAQDGSTYQEPRSAWKRGFTAAECKAAASTISSTKPGDVILGTSCVPATAPPPADEQQLDPRNKGAI